MAGKSRMAMAVLGAVLAVGIVLLLQGPAAAHCDTLDGPVVVDARAALQQGDVTPVLKWVRAADEQEIRGAFARTLAVRKLSPEAGELVDMYFFETLVRVHRAGEGASYTGLKPAGGVEPAIARADQALEKGSIDDLARTIASHAEAGVRERFARVLETRRHAGDSVAAGREFVEAYVTFIHYVEALVGSIHGRSHHGEAEAPHP